MQVSGQIATYSLSFISVVHSNYENALVNAGVFVAHLKRALVWPSDPRDRPAQRNQK
jgi:hypothetical protein